MSATNNGSGEAQDRMLGSVPGAQALGRGPAPDGTFSRHDYHHPAAGWGAARSVGRVLGCDLRRSAPASGSLAWHGVLAPDYVP